VEFHLALPNGARDGSPEALIEIAEAAEELGFAGVMALDHLLVGNDLREIYSRVFEPLVVLSYLAARTRRVRLGTSVIVLGMRNPFVVAKQVATLDALSGGRVILGLGAGYSEPEFVNVGAGDRFHTRGRRLDEAIGLFRHLFGGEKGGFEGRFYSYQTGYFEPLPPQGARLPILIGGNSDAAIRRAAQLGDVWQSTRIGPDEFKPRVERLRQLAGDRKVEVGARTALEGSPAEMRSRIEQWRDAGAQHLCLVFGRHAADTLERMRAFAGEVMAAAA